MTPFITAYESVDRDGRLCEGLLFSTPIIRKMVYILHNCHKIKYEIENLHSH